MPLILTSKPLAWAAKPVICHNDNYTLRYPPYTQRNEVMECLLTYSRETLNRSQNSLVLVSPSIFYGSVWFGWTLGAWLLVRTRRNTHRCTHTWTHIDTQTHKHTQTHTQTQVRVTMAFCFLRSVRVEWWTRRRSSTSTLSSSPTEVQQCVVVHLLNMLCTWDLWISLSLSLCLSLFLPLSLCLSVSVFLNDMSFNCVISDASTYAHYLFNAFDTTNNGSIKFEVWRQLFFQKVGWIDRLCCTLNPSLLLFNSLLSLLCPSLFFFSLCSASLFALLSLPCKMKGVWGGGVSSRVCVGVVFVTDKDGF